MPDDAAVERHFHGVEVGVVALGVGVDALLGESRPGRSNVSGTSGRRRCRATLSGPGSLMVNGTVNAAVADRVVFRPDVAHGLVDVGDARRQAGDQLALEVGRELVGDRAVETAVDGDEAGAALRWS